MSKGQTVALWIAAVSLLVIAVFSALDYGAAEDHRQAEIAHRQAEIAQWAEMKFVACTQSILAMTDVVPSVETLELLSEFGFVENVLDICNNIELP